MNYFLDTSYLVALTHKRDQYHKEAVSVRKTLKEPVRLVTTSAVLMEFGNMLSSVHFRDRVFSYILLLKNDKNTEIVFVTEQMFESALNMFGKYHDKEWGLVDCLSFLVMQENGITHALTSDKHFEQAGFTALLKSRRFNYEVSEHLRMNILSIAFTCALCWMRAGKRDYHLTSTPAAGWKFWLRPSPPRSASRSPRRSPKGDCGAEPGGCSAGS